MADLNVVNGADRINRYPAAAGLTCEIGQPVTKDSAGRVVLADATTTSFLGIAARKMASAAADDEVLVYDDPQVEFDIAADNVAQVTQTNVVGKAFDLVVSSSVFYANLDATSTNVLKGLAIANFEDPLRDGSTYGGSALAGDWTPGWQSKNRLRCKFALHLLAN